MNVNRELQLFATARESPVAGPVPRLSILGMRWIALRRNLARLLKSSLALPILISCLVVVPCFWRPIVCSADLQSHLYNAWLAGLIRSGSVSGVWIGHQSTNVLVDFVLGWLIKPLGVSGAERVLTTIWVLVFFWGSFKFISAISGRPVYWVLPWLAILSYGFVFQVGLLNYYISAGLVFWLFALLWGKPIGWQMLLAPFVLILAYVAHPLPVLWFIGMAAYCKIAQKVRWPFQFLLFCCGVGIAYLIRSYIASHYYYIWKHSQPVLWTGADQVLLYNGRNYLPVAIAILLFSFILLLYSENRWRSLFSLPAQAYFLTAIVIMIFPTAIRVSTQNAWSSYIADRLSLLSGVLLFAVLGQSVYRKWYLPVGIVVAAVFFGALYKDVGKAAQIEAKMQELVDTLPNGQRVISYVDLDEENASSSSEIRNFPHWLQRPVKSFLSLDLKRRNPYHHLVSRACIGHCFDYMNYEPSTGQFRIHAQPGNPVVVANVRDVSSMENGTYVVKATDPPLYVLFRCGAEPTDLCLRLLAQGEWSAKLAYPDAVVVPR